jgi:hypothetical protein
MDVLELAAKAAVALGSLKFFIETLYKPLMMWRKEQQAKRIREAIAPELEQMHALIDEEKTCTSKMQAILEGVRSVFLDHDVLIEIASDNRDRLDENNDLLDAIGLSTDRRISPADLERRRDMVKRLQEVHDRRVARERSFADHIIPKEEKP